MIAVHERCCNRSRGNDIGFRQGAHYKDIYLNYIMNMATKIIPPCGFLKRSSRDSPAKAHYARPAGMSKATLRLQTPLSHISGVSIISGYEIIKELQAKSISNTTPPRLRSQTLGCTSETSLECYRYYQSDVITHLLCVLLVPTTFLSAGIYV